MSGSTDTGVSPKRHHSRRRSVTAAALLVGALLLGSCTPTADTSVEPTVTTDSPTDASLPATATGATITMAMTEPEDAHPHHVISDGAVEIAGLVHEGLTVLGRDGRALPGLATSWTSDNSITWTFALDPAASFSDGTPVTSTVIVDSWQRAAAQATRARAGFLGVDAGITGWDDTIAGIEDAVIDVRAIDPTTVVVQLDQSNPWLPEAVAHPVFAASLAPRDEGYPIGAGPYLIADRSDGVAGLTLALRTDGATDSLPARIDVEFVDDDATAAARVESGGADLAVVSSVSTLPATTNGVDTVTVAANTLWYLGYPTSRGPLSEPESRLVLSMAIDRAGAAANFDARQAGNPSFAPPHAVTASEVTCDRCAFDLEGALTAAQELDVEAPEEPISLHLVAGSPGEAWADVLAETWTTELEWQVNIVRWDDLRSLVGFLQSGVPDGPFILSWTGGHPGAEAWIEPLLDRTGADDFVRYGNETLNEHFRLIGSTPVSDVGRRSLVAALGETLNEALAYVPLSVGQRHVVFDPSSITVGPRSSMTGVDLRLVRVLP